jgi:hypothetical protein
MYRVWKRKEAAPVRWARMTWVSFSVLPVRSEPALLLSLGYRHAKGSDSKVFFGEISWKFYFVPISWNKKKISKCTVEYFTKKNENLSKYQRFVRNKTLWKNVIMWRPVYAPGWRSKPVGLYSSTLVHSVQGCLENKPTGLTVNQGHRPVSTIQNFIFSEN